MESMEAAGGGFDWSIQGHVHDSEVRFVILHEYGGGGGGGGWWWQGGG